MQHHPFLKDRAPPALPYSKNSKTFAQKIINGSREEEQTTIKRSKQVGMETIGTFFFTLVFHCMQVI
jgi:hypothetical protein